MTAKLQVSPLEEFWSRFEKKGWVVTLVVYDRGSRVQARDTKYVTARTREGAIRTARLHSFLNNAEANARLAHPEKDLGAKWSGNGPSPLAISSTRNNRAEIEN